MRAVGLKVLKNRLSEYVRLAATGETVLVTDRDRVVAELGPPRESRVPPQRLWGEPLSSSRLLEYEVWTRIHGRRLAGSHGESVRALIGRVALVELAPPVLSRALEPFARPVRTLDALHLASMEFLRT